MIILIDEVGTWPPEILTAPDTQNFTGNLVQDDRFELTEGPEYKTADYWPMDVYLPPQEPFCHSCKRRHNPNVCVRRSRSKHLKI